MLVPFDGFRTVAAQTGWKLDPPDPGMLAMGGWVPVTLSGNVDGFPLRLDREMSTYGFTTNVFFPEPLPVVFAITHEGLGGKVKNALGFHDVEVGDPEIDKRFRIISKDPEAVKKLLSPPVRTMLIDLDGVANSFGSSYRVTQAAVSFTRPYMMPMSAEEVMLDVPFVIALAKAIREAARGA